MIHKSQRLDFNSDIAIVICTYNPDEQIFARTLNAVQLLEIPEDIKVECIVVDNNSSTPVEQLNYVKSFLEGCNWARVISEYKQGLTFARITGVQSTAAPIIYFSKCVHVWGWASWRRAWKHYDVRMKTWQEYKNLDLINSVCSDPDEKKVWIDNFDKVYNGGIDTWDYQWVFTCWSQNGLSILPNFNLISDIGFRPDATHTIGQSSQANLPTTDIWEIKDFPFIARHYDADKYTFDNHYGGNDIRKSRTLTNKIRRNLAKIKSRIPKEVMFWL